MNTFKIGDRVIIKESNVDKHYGSHNGRTGIIVRVSSTYSFPYLVKLDDENCELWCKVYAYVEDKKVFTKSDLKSGMFGYFDNETDDWFVIAGDRFVYQQGLGDDVSMVDDNLESPSGRKITALYSARSFNHAKKLGGKLIWKREEKKPESPLYNGKVVCVEVNNNPNLYTKGKIYQFKDGNLTADNGCLYPDSRYNQIHTFKDWANWTASKFIEVVE